MAKAGSETVVVKVGGSLYDLPDLGRRLRALFEGLGTRRLLLVPGGGAAADVIRALDRTHQLGQESAHWLALRALSLNAWFLARLVNGIVVGHPTATRAAWEAGQLTVLDGFSFALADEAEPEHLPHSWDVTSDSIALRAALVLDADQLVLCKSAPCPKQAGDNCVPKELVDPYFCKLRKDSDRAARLRVALVNLRHDLSGSH